MAHIGFKQAQERGLVLVGAGILSYPNRKGEAYVGVIIGINSDRNEIAVEYVGYGRSTLKLNGRLISDKIDTSLDIGMITINE